MANGLDDIYALLGYRFADPSLLEQALTHPSCTGVPNYQRLEFIGDRAKNVKGRGGGGGGEGRGANAQARERLASFRRAANA